tara:strand:- start:728 stop:1588 length:861 start_codon:yes stop_codon:yes gene_type:complete
MSYNRDDYIRNITESRVIIREMLSLMRHQEENLSWIDNNNFQNNNSIYRSNSPIIQQRRGRTTNNHYSSYASRRNGRQHNRNRQQYTNFVNNHAQSTPTTSQTDTINTFQGLADIFTNSIISELASSMTPVVVQPTQQTITTTTETIPYVEITEPIYTQCPISHEQFDINSAVTRIRHCGHYFDPESILQWLTTSVICPVCRHDIRDGVENTSNINLPETVDQDNNNSNDEIQNTNPDTLETFMNVVTRDILEGNSNNVSLQFEFIPLLNSQNNNTNDSSMDDNIR